jgi:DNA-binding MarR family transcriptional regulator
VNDQNDFQLDALLSEPNRLGVMADLVRHGGTAAFVEVCKRRHIVHYGTLTKHNERLERAGYIELRKNVIAGNRMQTRLQITPKGRTAFAQHRSALAVLLNMATEAGMAAA